MSMISLKPEGWHDDETREQAENEKWGQEQCTALEQKLGDKKEAMLIDDTGKELFYIKITTQDPLGVSIAIYNKEQQVSYSINEFGHVGPSGLSEYEVTDDVVSKVQVENDVLKMLALQVKT